MSRARNIKPGFFKNEILAECHPLARILFAGLWCEADREGRLEDRPKRLKADCLPYDDCDVNDLLQQLADRGFIRRYEVNGTRYIQILEFLKHQNPHVRELPSSIPAPSDAKHNLGSDEAQPRHDLGSDEHGTGPADSPFLIPDSPSSKEPSAQQAERVDGPLTAFEQFWSAYPRKQGKQDAVKAFGKIKPDQSLLGKMLKAIADQRRSVDWLKDGGQFIPHPATWLNGRRWEDEVSTGPPIATQQPPGKQVQAIQNLEAMKHGGLDSAGDSHGLSEIGVLRLGADAGR